MKRSGPSYFPIILPFFFFHWHYSPLWALACRKYPSIFPYLSPTLSIFSLPALEDLFLLLLCILSWIFPIVSSLPVLGWRYFFAHVTHMVSRILRWFLDTWKICAPQSLVCIKIPTKRLISEHEIRSQEKCHHSIKCHHTYEDFSPSIFTHGFQRKRKQGHLGLTVTGPNYTKLSIHGILRWREFNIFWLLPRLGFGTEERTVLSAQCWATVI